MREDPAAPRVFMSYSWDGDSHENWVLQLATRLRDAGGVDVVLDRWDTALGSDLGLFMERAADSEYRVIAVCTARYVQKADASDGGVGYEKKMITPSLMADLHGNRVIPVIRDNDDGLLPRFLGAAKYVDFRVDSTYEARYYELLQDLHGMESTPKPAIGRNPFLALPEGEAEIAIREEPARYVMPSLTGQVTFDFSNNDGRYVVGAGDRSFTVRFSGAGYGSVYIYTDGTGLRSVALAKGVSSVQEVGDASRYDGSSRVRHIRVGDAAILRNANDYWAAIFLDAAFPRDTGPTGDPSLTFRFVIPPVPNPDFADVSASLAPVPDERQE